MKWKLLLSLVLLATTLLMISVDAEETKIQTLFASDLLAVISEKGDLELKERDIKTGHQEILLKGIVLSPQEKSDGTLQVLFFQGKQLERICGKEDLSKEGRDVIKLSSKEEVAGRIIDSQPETIDCIVKDGSVKHINKSSIVSIQSPLVYSIHCELPLKNGVVDWRTAFEKSRILKNAPLLVCKTVVTRNGRLPGSAFETTLPRNPDGTIDWDALLKKWNKPDEGGRRGGVSPPVIIDKATPILYQMLCKIDLRKPLPPGPPLKKVLLVNKPNAVPPNAVPVQDSNKKNNVDLCPCPTGYFVPEDQCPVIVHEDGSIEIKKEPGEAGEKKKPKPPLKDSAKVEPKVVALPPDPPKAPYDPCPCPSGFYISDDKCPVIVHEDGTVEIKKDPDEVEKKKPKPPLKDSVKVEPKVVTLPPDPPKAPFDPCPCPTGYFVPEDKCPLIVHEDGTIEVIEDPEDKQKKTPPSPLKDSPAKDPKIGVPPEPPGGSKKGTPGLFVPKEYCPLVVHANGTVDIINSTISSVPVVPIQPVDPVPTPGVVDINNTTITANPVEPGTPPAPPVDPKDAGIKKPPTPLKDSPIDPNDVEKKKPKPVVVPPKDYIGVQGYAPFGHDEVKTHTFLSSSGLIQPGYLSSFPGLPGEGDVEKEKKPEPPLQDSPKNPEGGAEEPKGPKDPLKDVVLLQEVKKKIPPPPKPPVDPVPPAGPWQGMPPSIFKVRDNSTGIKSTRTVTSVELEQQKTDDPPEPQKTENQEAGGEKIAAANISSIRPSMDFEEACKTGKIEIKSISSPDNPLNCSLTLSNPTSQSVSCVLKAFTIFISKNPETSQHIMKGSDPELTLAAHETRTFPVDTYCVSTKTVKPPPSSGAAYSLGAYPDAPAAKMLPKIVQAAEDLERKHSFDAVPIAAEMRLRKIAQTSIWMYLGKRSGKASEFVNTETLMEDFLKSGNLAKESLSEEKLSRVRQFSSAIFAAAQSTLKEAGKSK